MNEKPTRTERSSKSVARDLTESLGKIPPQAVDLEEAVLGALMLEKNAIIEVAGMLRPDHFYSDAHQEIYSAIVHLFGAGEPIDMRTVVAKLRKNGKLEIVGGAYAIAEITSKVSSAANVEYHSRIIIEMSMKRSMIELASQIHHDAYEDQTDIFSLIDTSNYSIQTILDNAINSRAEKSMKEISVAVIQEQQERQSGKLAGLNTGHKVVDLMLSGLQRTDLIIIAARPGMGKTAFVVQAMKHIALHEKKPVGMFSMEMSSNQLVQRLAIAESEVDAERVKKGILDGAGFNRYIESLGTLAKAPMFIDDTPFMTIVELRARAMRMKTKYGVQLIVVDYLQLIKGLGDGGQRISNRDQEIGVITRTLKGMAKELDIPIIAISQLSRAVEQRGGDRKPQLSDLRESGSIEQDADIVMFLYRPEYYKITSDDDGNPTHGLCEVIIAKHRGGSVGDVKLKFIGKFTKFDEWWADKHVPDYVGQQKSPLPKEKDDSFNEDNPF